MTASDHSPTTGRSDTRRRVARRSPDVARDEILEAAAFLLSTNPFRDLSVRSIMALTQIGRSAFYTYFNDIYSVVEKLLSDIRDEEISYLESWKGSERETIDTLKQMLANSVNLWAARGPMISSMLDAAPNSPRLEEIFEEITESYCRIISDSLRREHALGRIPEIDYDEVAEFLIVGSQAYMKAKLGKVGRGEPLRVAETLQELWINAIYGGASL